MPRVSSLHIIKALNNNKKKHNKFFIMIKRNSKNINVHSNTQQLSLQIWRLSKVRTGWPYP